jgi:hypothetical protein
MRQVFLTVLIAGLAATVCLAQGEDVAAKKQRPNATRPPGGKPAFLGLEIESLPPPLAGQLPGIVPKGQGVLVLRVAKDSPAASAGLQPYDILVSYDDHPLDSPERLIRLVRDDTPGHEVSLGFVRGGKAETCKVTLGAREFAVERERPRVFRLRPEEGLRRMFEEFESTNDGAAWESFDALKLTRLDEKRWRAEIEYRSKEGKKEHKTFEGTRAEIRKDIQADDDLPASERTHLLRALNLHEPVFEFHFPPFGPMLPPGFSDQP